MEKSEKRFRPRSQYLQPEDITVHTDDGILTSMAEEVRLCNIEHGWYDSDPRVQDFHDWYLSQYGTMDLTLLEKVEALFGPRTFGDDVALLHSEVSEMLEAFRKTGSTADQTSTIEIPGDDPRAKELRRQFPEVVSSSDPMEDNTEQFGAAARELGFLPKPEGVGAEAADVLVRLLDTCSRYGIDLFAEWRRKVDYNWSRPIRHGNKAL